MGFFWKNNKYIIGSIPIVFNIRMNMNHINWLLLPHFHNAIPFHINDQIDIINNKGIRYTIFGIVSIAIFYTYVKLKNKKSN